MACNISDKGTGPIILIIGNLVIKKILSIFGTRPEAIKMAPVLKEFEKYPRELRNIVCVTAQHREMLDQVLDIFHIKPDHDLNIMRTDQSLTDVTTRALQSVSEIIRNEKPDLVLVQGDTTTAFVGSLAAFYEKIPVGHIEAGLRTFDKHQPFPEEINRRLTTQIADLHFAPTDLARKNLLLEGVAKKKIFVTGNTVIDALNIIVERQSSKDAQREWLRYFKKNFNISLDNEKKIILVTGHRRENFGEGFENICHALNKIAQTIDNIKIIYPVHLNPNVQEPVYRIVGNQPNIRLIPPLDYEPFVFLMSRSYLVLTDSGGIQEEAPSLGKPVLVMRETTERPEAVKKGTAKLVGASRKKIFDYVTTLMTNSEIYDAMAKASNPYGDGKATGRILTVCNRFLMDTG